MVIDSTISPSLEYECLSFWIAFYR